MGIETGITLPLSTFTYTREVYFEVGKVVHRIKIHQGKVASLEVDAIVSPIVVEEAANKRFQSPDCPVGEVRVVPASNGTARAVIEVVGPAWRGGDHEEEEQLASCYRKAMDMAKRQNFRNIAFAPIAGGARGFPANRATRIAVQQVDSALRQNPLMESVIFCCSDPLTTALYRSQVGR